MTNFRKHYLRLTVRAINVLFAKERTYVDTKTIRRLSQIPSTDRSSINFIWRSLEYLENQGYIEKNGRDSPQLYEITSASLIDIKKVLNKY